MLKIVFALLIILVPIIATIFGAIRIILVAVITLIMPRSWCALAHGLTDHVAAVVIN